jgi:diaminopimelate decarboxylase
VRVAIAGLGPKGLFALERLLDHARDLIPPARLEIDVFEPHSAPGAGPVYDPAQPDYLRMNFAAGALDMWWPASRAVPRARRRSFVEWRAANGARDEAYPPRAHVGRYLADGLAALLRHAPPTVEVRVHRAPAEGVREDAYGWHVEAGGVGRSYDEVLIAVGHQATSASALAASWSHAAPLVPAVFPVERWLTRDLVPPGATVAVRGFALTFIDAALALTEGRGGSFEQLDHPYRLRYLPGEDDAGRILPFTRTGRPMLAKPDPAIAAGTPALERIAALGRARLAALARPVHLTRDVEPILAGVAAASLRATTPAGWTARTGSDPDLAVRAADAIERSLAVGAGLVPPDRNWALGHAWRALYPAIVAKMSDDGLAARDWPAFLRLAAEMERVAFGPPSVNAAKLLALVHAGRIDLRHLRGGELVSRDGQTRLRSEHGSEPVDVAVDAVLPGPGALGHGGLLADLVASGHARIASGRRGLDVAADGTCRGVDGSLSPGLSAIGRPTEDSVIGNDTLSRSLHPHADRWAQRVVRRCRERSLPTTDTRRREPAPA